MRPFDLSPLMQSAIGFDELFRMAEKTAKGFDAAERSYPPYNIEKHGQDDYRITMALAGFGLADISVSLEDGLLTVSGKVTETEQDEDRQFIHRGIATRAFQRKFQLAGEILVTGASFDNGLLHIELMREVPEHKKPRDIPIAAGTAGPVLEGVKSKVEKSKKGKQAA
ncbi:MAG: Hsp20 family protein [Proteobacteria bacterium]|nr:Hsp20 family protein [Pseudomonadota bacterium]